MLIYLALTLVPGEPYYFNFIYLTERAQVGGAAEGEGETYSPLRREPYTGLNPRTLRS